jgi:uncharacterized protein YoxC
MGWTVLTAVSVLVIALLMLALTVAAILLARDVRRALDRLGEVSRTLEQDGRPALQSVRIAAEEAGRVATALRQEVDGLVGASQRIRTHATEIADRVGERVGDLEVVLDILQEEVEDTALDVAAALRATRRGAGLFRSLKRAVLGRRR